MTKKPQQVPKMRTRAVKVQPIKTNNKQISMVRNYAPVAVAVKATKGQPTFRGVANGVRIQHTEFVSELQYAGNTDFNVTMSLPINPGIPTTFPWLSGVADLFEKYIVHSLRFHTQPALPSSTAGSIYMEIDYNAADPSPPNKAEFMSSMSAVSGSIWSPVELSGDLKRVNICERFVRIGSTPANTDVKTYDVGTLFVATQGYSTGPSGNLYVSYDISLIIPGIPPAIEYSVSQNISFNTTSGYLSNGSSYTQLGNGNIAYPKAGAASTGSLAFTEPGQYLVDWVVNGTATSGGPAAATWSITAGTASSVAATQAGQIYTSITETGIYQALVTAVDALCVVQLALSNLSATTSCVIRIAKYLAANS